MKQKLHILPLLVLIPILFQCSDVLEWFISGDGTNTGTAVIKGKK